MMFARLTVSKTIYAFRFYEKWQKIKTSMNNIFYQIRNEQNNELTQPPLILRELHHIAILSKSVTSSVKGDRLT